MTSKLNGKEQALHDALKELAVALNGHGITPDALLGVPMEDLAVAVAQELGRNAKPPEFSDPETWPRDTGAIQGEVAETPEGFQPLKRYGREQA